MWPSPTLRACQFIFLPFTVRVQKFLNFTEMHSSEEYGSSSLYYREPECGAGERGMEKRGKGEDPGIGRYKSLDYGKERA